MERVLVRARSTGASGTGDSEIYYEYFITYLVVLPNSTFQLFTRSLTFYQEKFRSELVRFYLKHLYLS